MFLLELSRIAKFALQNLWRNVWLSIVTITIVSLALFTITFLLVFSHLTQHVMQTVEQKTDVYIDLTKDATLEQAQTIIGELKKLPAVKSADFVTPEDTLQSFRERHKNDELIIKSLDSLQENPFRGSIKLSVYNIGDFPTILSELSKQEYSPYLEIDSQDFSDSKVLVAGISDYSKKIQNGGLVISLIFILISVLVVFNTIQVGIYTHREEIGIMRLVGASNSFIRSPFLIEGLIYSFISMIVVAILTYPFLGFIQGYVDSFFKDYTVNLISLVNQNWLQIFGLQLLVAMVITILSSFVAVRRYLKV